MKKITAKLSAILTAAVMVVSAAGTVFAEEEQQEAPKYTGWSAVDGGWQYLVDGKPNTEKINIDGKMCWFSVYGVYIGGYSGMVNGRKYAEGLPVTGWTDNDRTNEYREEYYCFNGYPVTGDLNIGDKIYSFGKTGKYTGKSRSASVAVSCAEKISADTDKIKIAVENLDGKSHEIKIAQNFERLKNGKWESCKNGRVVYSKLDKELSENGENRTFEVDVDEYSRGKFGTGFYRLPIDCGGETYYAVFEAISPIELKARNDEYAFADTAYPDYARVLLDLTVNSAEKNMQAEKIATNISVKLEKKIGKDWTEIEGISYDIGYTDDENRLEVGADIPEGEGYYKLTVTANGKSCSDTFFVRKHTANAWLDEYDLNDKDISISFHIVNQGCEPIKVCKFPGGLYEKNTDGEWQLSSVERTAIEIPSDAYIPLNSGKSTNVTFALSRYYNISELKAGEYAVDIGGIGLGEFTLTDKPTEKNLPFKDLKAEDVKEISFNEGYIYFTQTAVIKPGNAKTKITDETNESGWRELTAYAESDDYLERALTYLRQFEIKGRFKNYEMYVGGSNTLTVTYKDGTKTELYFETNDAVRSDGEWYHCGGYTIYALIDMLEELTARNLPFEDIYDNEPIQIQLKKIDGDTVNSVELTNSNDYLHSQVVDTHYFELKEVIEDYKISADKEFQVILIYKGGIRETLTFFEPNVVMMPDGKIYRCYSSSYYEGLTEIFGVLENTASEQN